MNGAGVAVAPAKDELHCRYCGRRCFVLRTMPATALHYAGKDLLLATCPDGMDFDRRSTGHDHTTAFDPAAPWPPGEAKASPSAAPGRLPHLEDAPAAAVPCEVCALPVTAAYVARTGRAQHGPCASRADRALEEVARADVPA